ncbi:MAG: polysaccharide deacetylase family protein [Nitrospira sp.]|nr:polysaccharide deacetylase family protein [Nitrospira sp.]
MSKLKPQLSVLLRQSFWSVSCLAYTLARSDSDHLLVLTYHRVTPDVPWSDSLVVTPDQFEQQVNYVKRHFRLLSASEVAEIIRAGKSFPVRSCLITFDDGWKDNYTHAFPVLHAYQAPAIIFLATGYIGTNKRFWHDRLTELLWALPFQEGGRRSAALWNWATMSMEQLIQEVSCIPFQSRQSIIAEITDMWKPLEELAVDRNLQQLEMLQGQSVTTASPTMLSWENVVAMSAGGIEFGSHTMSHAFLDRVTAPQLNTELRLSKEMLESRLSKPVEFIAYPNGNYNEAVIAASQECGYVGGFTCDVGFNVTSARPFELRRKHVLNDLSVGWDGKFSEAFFATELSGIRHAVKARIRGAWRARY